MRRVAWWVLACASIADVALTEVARRNGGWERSPVAGWIVAGGVPAMAAAKAAGLAALALVVPRVAGSRVATASAAGLAVVTVAACAGNLRVLVEGGVL